MRGRAKKGNTELSLYREVWRGDPLFPRPVLLSLQEQEITVGTSPDGTYGKCSKKAKVLQCENHERIHLEEENVVEETRVFPFT
jgi:hypothetical protein